MQKTIFLTLDQILIIHEDQIDRYGGSHGIRDLSLLESALFRPQSIYANSELYPTIFDKAASLMHSLIFNHCFVDGNKRTATVASIIFLSLNDYSFTLSEDLLVKKVLQIEIEQWNVERISLWLKTNSIKSI